MRSSHAWLLALALLGGPAAAAEPASAPTRAQVTEAVEQVRKDRDLGGTRLQKTLRFKDTETQKPPDPKTAESGFWAWLRDFSRWLTEAGRIVVWVLAAIAVAAVLVGLRHWVRVRAGAVRGPGPALPSHVRELDIRPESLPERIGAAAAALWQRGEHRPALSLLYRGALSRLVHQHAVPIRAASTEGECAALAAVRLAPERSAFFGRLVQAWQLAVYGARLPDTASVLALCAEFDVQLPAAPAAQPASA
ncbi:MAG TPA: DUF4129 domain-containing protein [Rhizobacter sp.]|nr:DUF4129 domain-containing protein [Rhizobacter sp.]